MLHLGHLGFHVLVLQSLFLSMDVNDAVFAEFVEELIVVAMIN